MLFASQILGRCSRPIRGVGIALALCGLLGLAGCGQKGPLYIPAPADNASPAKTTR